MPWMNKISMRTRITLGFAVFSTLWILLIDWILEYFITEPLFLDQVQFWEELFYVLIASVIIYALLKIYFSDSDRLPQNINSRRFLDGLAEGVILLDMTGKVVDCNHTSETILNLPREIIINLNLLQASPHSFYDRHGIVIPPDQYPHTVTLKTGNPCDGKVMGIDLPTGARLWLLVSTRLLTVDDKPEGVSMSFINITIRQNALNDLETAYNDTLNGLASALDLRDHSTGQHTQRVASMTIDLAREFGIPEEEIENIYRGATLHDIGKMGIPDSILSKPGKLTDAEWVVMKRHPEIAADMLDSIPFLKPAMDIPLCHHEQWDGSGYPRGLSGEDIPLAARLFAVVDVYDAITSERPYRDPTPKAEALRHIEMQAGTHFDPAIVKVFSHMLRGDVS